MPPHVALAFQWKRRRYRGTLDDVLGRHIAGKTEALKEVEKIYDDDCAQLGTARIGDRTADSFPVVASSAKLNLHMHDLRREAGSRLLERGVDLHTVQLFLDHANISTSSRYLKPSKLALHTAIQRIDAQRRASGEASKWEQELAEMKQNLQAVPQKYHKLVESTAEQGSKRTATARRINRLGA